MIEKSSVGVAKLRYVARVIRSFRNRIVFVWFSYSACRVSRKRLIYFTNHYYLRENFNSKSKFGLSKIKFDWTDTWNINSDCYYRSNSQCGYTHTYNKLIIWSIGRNYLNTSSLKQCFNDKWRNNVHTYFVSILCTYTWVRNILSVDVLKTVYCKRRHFTENSLLSDEVKPYLSYAKYKRTIFIKF